MSSKTIYLYLKTHNKTGLKYLGKTVNDPYTYKGSGKIWKHHIKKHGYDVTTEILLETEDETELRETGLKYSELWNIVESKSFANLKPEDGDGGARIFTEESRMKQSIAQKKRWETYDSKERDLKISDSLRGRVIGCPNKKSEAAKNRKNHPWTGKKRPTKTCPHCQKVGADYLMTRWHFSNCPSKDSSSVSD